MSKKYDEMRVFGTRERLNGFNFEPGFVALFIRTELIAATSGWESGGYLMVYRPDSHGRWTGRWEDDENFPVTEALEAIQEWNYEKELSTAIEEGKNKVLHISEEDIVFTNVVPGELCNNGGEYGFYSRYIPLDHPGIYQLFTETTCDFDSCGTGYEGVCLLTEDEYLKLKKESDKIEKAGSLYKSMEFPAELKKNKNITESN